MKGKRVASRKMGHHIGIPTPCLMRDLCRYANVNIVAKGDNNSIPDPSTWKLSENAAYVSYCDNETIQGVEFKGVPEVIHPLSSLCLPCDFPKSPP